MLLHQLTEIARTFSSSGEQIWGFGFDPVSIPMLFVHRGQCEEDSFGIACGPVERHRLASVPRGEFGEIVEHRTPMRRKDDVPFDEFNFVWVNSRIVEHFGPDPGQEVAFAADLGDSESLVFDFSGPNYKPDSWEFARFVVHEAFHHHQLFDAKWRVPYGYDPATPPSSDAENARMATEESKLIEVAALAEDDATALQFVRRFEEIRRRRFERWPEIEMLERGTEQVEGSARYVENQYSRCNGRASRLNVPPEALTQDRDWLHFGRLYRSGARMLELLDRFGIDWRKQLTMGSDPYGIVLDELC